jgi:DNA sulfur modification protein DndD
MKIDKISINNFRQYYGSVSIDLQTNSSKNIVVIGGKNGYGKTNFLIALVWGLYGEKISQVDDNFKKEIQKEGNYNRFMRQSLNWSVENEGKTSFSIEIYVSDIELPGNSDSLKSNCIITREFDVESMEESLSIRYFNSNEEIFNTEEDKLNFIHDFIIPVEAAKFVFFDAEKIASLAELSTKDEGSVLNDALGKLLGLDIYEGLIDDLKIYMNNLKKEGANENIKEQITNTEKTIELNRTKIDEIEQTIAQNESKVRELKLKINDYNAFINEHSPKDILNYNREDVLREKGKLVAKETELEEKFQEMAELIPLAILTGKLEEVFEQIIIQDQNRLNIDSNQAIKERFDNFIEKLFNQPPDPQEGSMSFKNKVFYSQKAQTLLDTIFENNEKISELEFEHDLSNSDKELIQVAINLLRQQSKENFALTIESFNIVKNDILEIDNLLRKIDSNFQDELIVEYIAKKEEAERRIEKLISENGSLLNQKEELNKLNTRQSQQYQILIQKITVTEKRKQKLERASLYLKTLSDFVKSQKDIKKENLNKNIYAEMIKLMHKLQSAEEKLISEVKVEILPDDSGLKITLYDKDGRIIPKESLSQGEKQLYISSLIKAILMEAVQSYPIFIDTPLGRLDDEHIKNILLYYYPDLAEQVVILATNNEITPRRFNDIKNNVSKSYTLENTNNRTTFKPGYFVNYEN